RERCIPVYHSLIRIVELPPSKVTHCELRGVVRRKLSAQCLEERQLESVGAHYASAIDAMQMPRVVPPFREIAGRGFVLRETHRRERRGTRSRTRGGEPTRACDGARHAARAKQNGERQQAKEADGPSRQCAGHSSPPMLIAPLLTRSM